MKQTVLEFLELKPLYYKQFDPERIKQAFAVLKAHIVTTKTVHIVGTNGKGSTGRIIASMAYQAGLSVLHYSSPHIHHFSERFWLNNENISLQKLDLAHQFLAQKIDSDMLEALSYFEYATLLAFVVAQEVDLLVLEAGLGGEHDATNVYPKALSVFTPIGFDHQAFLGETIKDIATTKLRSMAKEALLAPQPYAEVCSIAKQIALSLNGAVCCTEEREEFGHKRSQIASLCTWPNYLCSNGAVALLALKRLGIEAKIENISKVEIKGRFESLLGHITIDVGHNPMAAKAIVEALKQPVVLIFNTLEDKDFKQSLAILKPKIKHLKIMPISTPRALEPKRLERALEELEIDYSYFDNSLDPSKEYLVFGSFYVVEAFLDYYHSRSKG